MPFAATRMDLHIVILSEVSQRKANKWYHLYVESKKVIQMNLFTKQTHRHRNQTYGYESGRERGKLEAWNEQIYITTCKIDFKKGPTV